MSMVGFPLLLIPLAIYNIIVFLMPGVSFAEPLLKLTLMSGAEWPVTLSDMLLALGILLLLFEVIKGARPGAKYLTDHLLSLIVFGGAAAEFCCGRSSAPRPISCWPCWRWWISCRALRCAPGAECRRRQPLRSPGGRAEQPATPRPNLDSIPRLRHRCRQRLRSPNPCCWITPNRKSCMPRLRRARRRRRSRRRGCSRAKARRRRRTRRRADCSVLR